MNAPFPAPGAPRRPPADEAAEWLARRDRGLTSTEQLAFDAWLSRAANARAWQEIEGPFRALDRAAALRPRDSTGPDPDLLLPGATASERTGAWGLVVAGVAAAALAIGFFTAAPRPAATPDAARGVVVRNVPGQVMLPDGSLVSFKSGTRVEPLYSATERRLRLSAGEAHFSVTKDAQRPFIVVIGSVEVRAVGTAFTVTASTGQVQVVVTEGRVRVDDDAGRNLVTSAAPAAPAALDAGQFVVIPVAPATPPAPVPAQTASRTVLENAEAWRSAWLEFGNTPLAEVVREFNRHGARHSNLVLKVADARTGRVLVSGTFRADSAAAFVRLLESTFGIDATHGSDGSVMLRRAE
jgi:transmembrane sensor